MDANHINFQELSPERQKLVKEYYNNENGTRHQVGTNSDGLTFYSLEETPNKMAVIYAFSLGYSDSIVSRSQTLKELQQFESQIESMTLLNDSDSSQTQQIQCKMLSKNVFMGLVSPIKDYSSQLQKLENKIGKINLKIEKRMNEFFDMFDLIFNSILRLKNYEFERLPKRDFRNMVKKHLKSQFSHLEGDLVSFFLEFQRKFNYKYPKSSKDKSEDYDKPLDDLIMTNFYKTEDYNEILESIRLIMPPECSHNVYFLCKIYNEIKLKRSYRLEILGRVFDFNLESYLIPKVQKATNDLTQKRDEFQKKYDQLKEKSKTVNLCLVEFEKCGILTPQGIENDASFLESLSNLKARLQFYRKMISLSKALAEKGLRQCDMSPESFMFKLGNSNAGPGQAASQTAEYIPLIGSFQNIVKRNRPCDFGKNSNNISFHSPDEDFPNILNRDSQAERYSLFSLAFSILKIEADISNSKATLVFGQERYVPDDPEYEAVLAGIQNFEFKDSKKSSREIFNLLSQSYQSFKSEIQQKIRDQKYYDFSVINNLQLILEFYVDLIFEKTKSYWRLIFDRQQVDDSLKNSNLRSMDSLKSLVKQMFYKDSEYTYNETLDRFELLAGTTSAIVNDVRVLKLEEDQ